MYYLINRHIQQIQQLIPQSDIDGYEYLRQNVQEAGTAQYQKAYKSYWKLNIARLSPAFYQAYFQLLQDSLNNNPPNIQEITQWLYDISARASDHRIIHFSFATKLRHMLDQHSPIYDSRVASFFLFTAPNQHNPRQRITEYINFYKFLVNVYGRVLRLGLLAHSIDSFRQQLNTQNFSDEKIIDSLIFYFVRLLREDGVEYE
jgi:hypothetical protein